MNAEELARKIEELEERVRVTEVMLDNADALISYLMDTRVTVSDVLDLINGYRK